MGMDLVDQLEREFVRADLADFRVGDTVDVRIRITEGDKTREQTFTGTVMRKRGGGTSATFTVRRIVSGEGVERTFPLHSPNLVSVKVIRRGRVRRARLYYLRKRVGKGVRVREKIWAGDERKVMVPSDETAPVDEVPDDTEELAGGKDEQS